jgi:hypothetical protein
VCLSPVSNSQQELDSDSEDEVQELAAAAAVDESKRAGGGKRALSVEEEEDLYEFIDDVYLRQGLPLSDSDISRLARDKWSAIHPAGPSTRSNQQKQQQRSFKASKGWVSDFKRSWHLSSRSPCISKIASSSSEEDEDFFRFNCADLFGDFPKNLVYNLDEIHMTNINPSLKIIGAGLPVDDFCARFVFSGSPAPHVL